MGKEAKLMGFSMAKYGQQIMRMIIAMNYNPCDRNI